MEAIKQSTEIIELAKALAAAQGEFDDAVANQKNPHYNSEYADMAAVRKAIKGPMAKNGLAITQDVVTSADDKWWLITTLLHSSGQWKQSMCRLVLEKATMQGLKSAVTYGRRTSVLSILGVAEADDDGNEAEKHPEPESKPVAKKQAKPAEKAPATEKKAAAQAAQQKDVTPIIPGNVISPIGSKKGTKVIDFDPVELNEYLAKTQTWFNENKTKLDPQDAELIMVFIEAGKEHLSQLMALESEEALRDLDEAASA